MATSMWAGVAILAVLSAVAITSESSAQSKGEGQKRGGQGRRSAYPAPTGGWKPASIILGAPTSAQIEVAVHAREKIDGALEYRISGGTAWTAGPAVKLEAGAVATFRLANLKANAAYEYRLARSDADSSPIFRFQTQRAPGSAFTFFVQGDSHPERVPKMHVPALYERTLTSAVAHRPDFFICMGDDFSVDTLAERTQSTVAGVYQKQVPYLGLVAHSAPLYLVNGNHEQASKANLSGQPENVAVWAQTARNRFFPQPAPDGFYTGNREPVEHVGLLRNYFAWTWGDALFVVIDPYWHSDQAVDNSLGGASKGRRDLWQISLGKSQYEWFRSTLESSKAKFKFVFAHHVHGTGRGGVEQATLYEWGGKSPNGSRDFAAKRPGWPDPIHQLMVKNGVTVFFQGHDHLFAKQELDGVVYQTTPVPADASMPLYNADAYRTGDKVAGAGLVKVAVEAGQARIEFLRSHLPDAEVDGRKHGEVAFAYTVKPR